MRKITGSSPYARAPVMGAAFGLLLVLGSIVMSAHGFLAFFSVEGLMIVVGGVMAVAFMSFQASDVHKALRAISNMLKESPITHEDLHRDTMDIIGWGRVVKQKGIRALEASIGKDGIDDTFVRYGLNMVVSEYTPEEVRSMMETAADACYERDSIPVDILEAMASHAPAFGMVGTLVGMVTMLCHLNGDITGIGSNLAIAFLSTLYGVVSARMVYVPAASKLRQEVEKSRFRNQLITEGMVMLVNNKSPMCIRDRLNSFLRPENHDYYNVFGEHTQLVKNLKISRS
ncbi:MotA/TolQ/ExbB proton channel [Syntrophobacter sp. SbD1]|nr:MotA/TolQ/ExbB proton channel [Syntrophobacter sp. SbD1]